MSLSNPRHTIEVLERYNMQQSKPNAVPLGRGVELGSGARLPEGNHYAEMVGSIMYLANQTRPDIAFAVGRLARRMATPTEGDWQAAKGVLRYLNGTRNMGIVYNGGQDLEAWVDSDYAGEQTTRKSTTGFVFMLHGGAVAWRSRLQRLVATSTATAEYVAAAEAAKESLWLRRVVGSLDEQARPVALHEDNQACIAMATNAGASDRTKHLDVCYHFLRDCAEQGQVVLRYVPSKEQIADGLTKALSADEFARFRAALGVGEVTPTIT